MSHENVEIVRRFVERYNEAGVPRSGFGLGSPG
jgi:hypothetical protein